MPTPNLFDYATKELSQDAMICWLIAWSQTEPRNGTERKLRDLGDKFVRALLAKCCIELVGNIQPIQADQCPKIYQQETVVVDRKRHSIDILACIQDKKARHVLLIEDKIDAPGDPEQLKRYYKLLTNGLPTNGDKRKKTRLKKVPKAEIRAIFLKTGNQSRSQDQKIEKEGAPFRVFNRQDFLEVLNTYQGNHRIVKDFQCHLQRKKDEYKGFEQWKCNDRRNKWEWVAWEGFFRELECKLKDGDWGYLSNQSGGLLGFWWHSRKIEDGEDIYLQLEISKDRNRQNLCFKVNAGSENESEQERIRDMYHKKIIATGKSLVKHPPRMGRGSAMTVAHWKDEWLKFNDSSLLDIDATVKNLKKAEKIVTAAAKDAGHNLLQVGPQNLGQGAATD